MPKIVDHEARRAELAAALWRVVGRSGMGAATVRAVAEEAGWSMGALRHYFATQEELLRFALDLLLERIPARLQQHLEADLDPHERARRLLLELVPVDEEHRIEAVVWLSFLERSRTDASLAEARELTWLGERHICRLVVAALLGIRAPDSPADHFSQATLQSTAGSPEVEAEMLHTFVDGITLQATTWPGQWTSTSMLTAVDRQLTGVLERAGR